MSNVFVKDEIDASKELRHEVNALTNLSINGKHTQLEEESGEVEGEIGQLSAELDEEGAAFTCQTSGGATESGGGKEATEMLEPTTNTPNKRSQTVDENQASKKVRFSKRLEDSRANKPSVSATDSTDDFNMDTRNHIVTQLASHECKDLIERLKESYQKLKNCGDELFSRVFANRNTEAKESTRDINCFENELYARLTSTSTASSQPSTNDEHTHANNKLSELEDRIGQLMAELDEKVAGFLCQITGEATKSGERKETIEIIESSKNTPNKRSQTFDENQASKKARFSKRLYDKRAKKLSVSATDSTDGSKTDIENRANVSTTSMRHEYKESIARFVHSIAELYAQVFAKRNMETEESMRDFACFENELYALLASTSTASQSQSSPNTDKKEVRLSHRYFL